MAMVINTNMQAINATRMLDQTSRQMSTSAERLTTGLRINSAADDAAGLAIATRMSSQINGTNQAVRNANDGISLVQTMDGAAGAVSDILQRMRELAVQSLNGTYSSNDRSLMDTEYDALQAEVKRVGLTSSFNGTKLFNGSNANVGVIADWKDTTNGKVTITFTNLSAMASKLGTASVGIDVISKASRTLVRLDAQISTLNTARAGWGAVQNRLEYTVANLQNVSENMTAARSQIQDADFAAETANLARTQVLQQAGMAMMSKANQNAQMVTKLLQ
jgi:flagellin